MDPFIRRDDGFLYEQIATTISSRVKNGTLQPGEQLPSVWQLSRTQDVSISTVMHAYRLLEDRGSSRHGPSPASTSASSNGPRSANHRSPGPHSSAVRSASPGS